MIIRADLVERNTLHGHAARGNESTEHRSWRGMIERCSNPKHIGFKYYGARGIKVCDRWRNDFSAFLADMGLKPSPKHTIDRINVDGDYEPGNCRWSTPSRQRENQRPYNESDRVLKAWETRPRIAHNRATLWSGQKFHRLTVVEHAGTSNDRKALWLCRCDCGNEVTVTSKSLRAGTTKSCGCLNRELARERAIIRNKRKD